MHEIGVLLLVFTPCLYCNVSDCVAAPIEMAANGDSARPECGWKSVSPAFALALVVERCPAGCTCRVRSGVMVCGIGTLLLFNANPLLRYDGYFILGDFLEVPNLQQQAWSEFVAARTAAGSDGAHVTGAGITFRQNATLAAGVRCGFDGLSPVRGDCDPLVSVSLARTQGLGRIAQVMQTLTIAAMLVGPAMQARPGMEASPLDDLLTLFRRAVLIGAILLLGTDSVTQPGSARPSFSNRPGRYSVYVTTDGFLNSIAEPGTVVKAGDEIMRLENPGR